MTRPVRRRPGVLLAAALLAALTCLGLSGCGGTGIPTSTVQPTLGPPTRTTEQARSSASEPSATRPPRSSIALPTRSADAIPTQEQPAPSQPPAQPVPTASPPSTAPEPISTPSPPPSQAAPSAPTATTSAAPWWLWALLSLLVVLLAVVTVVVSRSRRARKAWYARLDGVVAESTWLAHELVPDVLSAPDPLERRSTWTAYRPRVDALRNIVDEAVASAPRDGRDGVVRLRFALHDVEFAMDAYSGPVDDPTSLLAVGGAQRDLEEALRAIQPERRDTSG